MTGGKKREVRGGTEREGAEDLFLGRPRQGNAAMKPYSWAGLTPVTFLKDHQILDSLCMPPSSIYHWLASISPHSSTWSLPSLFFSDYFSLQRWVSGFQNVPGWTRTSGVGQLLLLCFICHSILQSLSDWLSLFSPCTFFLLVFFWHHIQLCCFQVFPSFPLLSCCCRWLWTFCVGVCPSIFPFWWRTVLI